MEKSKEIYLDYASATPLDKGVLAVMNSVFKKYFANPSAIHNLGVETSKILEDSRVYIAQVLGARREEIVFTSGATENNNLAVMGVLEKYYQNFSSKPHIVTTNIEHPSVMEVCKYLEKTKKAEITYVPVEENGVIDPRKIQKALKPNTVLVSVMYANNEIGTIQPIKEIAKEIRHFRKIQKDSFLNGLAGVGDPGNRGPEKNYLSEFLNIFPVFYTDATQAINYLPINVLKLGVDMLSFNGDKIYGPKDVGVLYIKKNTPLSKISFGGNQEFNLRPGTENTASIAGLSFALKITEKIKEKESKRLYALRNYFIKKILGISCDIKINGGMEDRLPNNVNITIPKFPSDLLVIELSARGIYISEKSACKSGEKKGSYVIDAINSNINSHINKKIVGEGSLRFSLGRETTKRDIDYTVKSLKDILKKLKKWYD
jgi:cysteine desulfurase